MTALALRGRSVDLLAPARRWPVPLAVLGGAFIGALYGGGLRAWMRLISTHPEFSWSGSGFIVGAFTVMGGLAGLVAAGRERAWGRALVAIRAIACVLTLSCFMAAGGLMFPTIVPGALAQGRSDWPRSLRIGLAVFAAGMALLVMAAATGDVELRTRLVATAIYGVLCLVEVQLMSELYAPSRPSGSLSTAAKVLPAVGGALLLGFLVLAARGV